MSRSSADMHVGLNLIYLVPGETGGMETYARELIPALLAERPELRLTAFINREAGEAGAGPWSELIPSTVVGVRARRRSEWVRGEQQLLPRLATRAGVDLLHSLGNTAPIWGKYRRVVTIQDLIYRLYPETHGRLRALGMGQLVPLAARRSDRILTPSESTRNDVVRLLGTPSEKIDVVPLGVTGPQATTVDEREVRQRYGLGDASIVLTMSAKRPHKNLMALLEAFSLLPEEPSRILVLPGHPTAHEAALRSRADALGIARSTRFIGWVSGDELEALYSAAACFVFPSLYEGFGLPVLEAMTRGVPVACSVRASLGEVVGDAAVSFDPERPEEIARAMIRILDDPVEADHLRAAGLARAASFTWAATARGTLRTYERALGADTPDHSQRAR